MKSLMTVSSIPVFDCGRAQRLDFADALPFGLDRLFPRGGQGLFVHSTGIRARVLRGRLSIAGFSFCGLIARTESFTPASGVPKIVTSPGCALRKHVLKSAGTVQGEISNGSQSVALNMPISLSFR